MNKNIASRSTRILITLVLLFSTRIAAAQEVEAWFARAKEANAYASIKPVLLALAEESRSGMLTDKPLADRLVEGAKKGVAPQKLASVLKEETSRLLSAATALRERELMPTDRVVATRLFTQIDIALRAGFDVADFEAALDGALKSLGKTKAVPSRAIAVLSAIAGIRLENSERIELISALSAGPFPDDRLQSVRSTWAGIASKNLSPAETAKIIAESFGPTLLRPDRDARPLGPPAGSHPLQPGRGDGMGPPTTPGMPADKPIGPGNTTPGKSAQKPSGH